MRHDEEIAAILHDQSDSNQNVLITDMGKIAQAQHRQEEIRKIAQACEDWKKFQGEETWERVFQLLLKKKQRYSVKPGNLQGNGKTSVVSENKKMDWGNLLGLIMSPPECRDMNLWSTEPVDFRYCRLP
ncbi:hypothetical protein SUGI_0538410 [Cryptomeria japonica]|nr:hypothetical protein SUGI_0538410 [Cryptomeria japonica]